jgi:hypothetical protein
VRRYGSYRLGPRYHALLDLWSPLCGARAKLPVGGVTMNRFDGKAATLDKLATKAHMAACARCADMLERGVIR